MTPKDQMAIKAAAVKQRDLTKRLSPHKVYTKYAQTTTNASEFLAGEFSGSKTNRSAAGQGKTHARQLSHFERVALQKVIVKN